jgi:hypothetical protein
MTVSENLGAFSINVSSDPSVLEVTYAGYSAKQIKSGDRVP